MKFYRQLKHIPPGMIDFKNFFNVSSQVPRIKKTATLSFDPINSDFYGGHWRYIINDPKLARYLYSQPNLKARRQMLSNREPDLAFANEDKLWSVRRKMVLAQLTSFFKESYLNSIFDSMINRVLLPYLNNIASTQAAWHPQDFFNHVLFSFGTAFVFGAQNNPPTVDSPLTSQYLQLLSTWMDTRFPALNVSSLPYARYIKKIYDHLTGHSIKMHEAVTHAIYDFFDEHFVIPAKYGYVDDDTYFKAIYENAANLLTDQQITADIFTLFIGFHATSYTALMGVLLAAKYPDIQQQVRLSLQQDNTIHNPYLQAFISETLRIDSVVSSVERMTVDDMTITLDKNTVSSDVYPNHVGKKYHLPKHATVIINSTVIHHSSAYWDSQDEMDLNNWLIKTKSHECQFKTRTEWLPFGVGVRACIGVRLAKKILAELFIAIFNNFDIKAPCDDPENQFTISTNDSLVRSLDSLAVIVRHQK